MRLLNVRALNLAVMIVLGQFAVFGLFQAKLIQVTMAVIAACFAIATAIAFWIIEARHPNSEVLFRFKSALARYASFWTTFSLFLMFLMTGKVSG